MPSNLEQSKKINAGENAQKHTKSHLRCFGKKQNMLSFCRCFGHFWGKKEDFRSKNEEKRRKNEGKTKQKRRKKKAKRSKTKKNEEKRRKTKKNEGKRRKTKENEEKRRKTKKNEEKRRKTKENEEKWRKMMKNKDFWSFYTDFAPPSRSPPSSVALWSSGRAARWVLPCSHMVLFGPSQNVQPTLSQKHWRHQWDSNSVPFETSVATASILTARLQRLWPHGGALRQMKPPRPQQSSIGPCSSSSTRGHRQSARSTSWAGCLGALRCSTSICFRYNWCSRYCTWRKRLQRLPPPASAESSASSPRSRIRGSCLIHKRSRSSSRFNLSYIDQPCG